MKYSSQKEFVDRIEREHARFVDMADAAPQALLVQGGAWGEGWSIKDLFAHLTEWEQMFLTWYRQGLAGIEPALPAPGYKWNETPRLNGDIWAKHKDKPQRRIRTDFDASYNEVLTLARSLTDEELLAVGFYAWTTKYPLTTYFGANTSSHYSAATKILRRWLKSS